MALAPISVNHYIYPGTYYISHLNNIQLERISKTISNNFVRISLLHHTFAVIPSLLEVFNIRYSEKQVKRIDENFFDYCIGTKYPLWVPRFQAPAGLSYLTDKYFSGDISGDIGESLFAYFFALIMNLTVNNVGHLRPLKRAGFLSPDFILWDRNSALKSFFGVQRFINNNLPILAEVKSSTNAMLWGPILKGLEQLQFQMIGVPFFGILFIAVRNQAGQNYHLYSVRVRS